MELLGPLPDLREALDGLTHRAVHPGPAGLAHVLVGGVLDEGVREAVVPRRAGHFVDHRRRLGPFQQVDELVLVDLGRLGQQVEVKVPADH